MYEGVLYCFIMNIYWLLYIEMYTYIHILIHLSEYRKLFRFKE